jgi:hypothetical protein
MPIHWNIEPIKLDDEINLLKRAGKRATHIIPVLLERGKNDDMFSLVVRYAIIFEDDV